MKFSCERCGKRYATAETPAPGRVYKIRCKACGHLIVVKGSAAPSSPAATAAAPAAPPTAAPPRRPPPPAAPELTAARLAAALERPDSPPPPPPVDPAFVDLFDDLEPAEPDRSAPSSGDPLRTPAPEPLPQAPAPAPPAAVRLVARPAQQKKGHGPVILIGVGALVLVGILTFVLLGGGGAPRPVAPSPQAQLQPPAQPAAPSPAPPSAAPTVPSPPSAAAAAPERRPGAAAGAASGEKRSPSREAPVRRPAREARPRAREPEEPFAVSAPADGRLATAEIQKVVAGSRKAFQACIAGSARSGDVRLDGRRVTLRLNVQGNGAVTYPSIDDPTLNGTDLGSCLKSSARVMVFPRFVGEPLQVDVRLVLAAR